MIKRLVTRSAPEAHPADTAVVVAWAQVRSGTRVAERQNESTLTIGQRITQTGPA
jgi:hypothetical protein